MNLRGMSVSEPIPEYLVEVAARLIAMNENLVPGVIKEFMADTKLDALGKIDSEQHSAMSKKIDQMKERIDLLERWKWMIVGGAIVIGYLVGHLDFFAKFLK